MLKKIIAIDQGEFIGGAEIFFSDLLNKLSKEYEIHLITGNNPEYLSRYSESNIRIYNINFFNINLRNIKNFYKFFNIINAYKKILLNIKPDLVISNTVRTHVFISRVTVAKKIPLIWMAHDTTFPKVILGFFIKCPKKIIACSNYVAQYFQSILNDKNKVDVIYPFGVDAGIFDKFSLIKKDSTIGMIGKFINWKGQDLFIKTAAELKKSGFNYKYEIIGSVYEGKKESEDYFKYCYDLIKSLGLEKDLIIKTDIKNFSQLIKEIVNWKFLIHYPRKDEPLGRVILEGMSAGCVILSNDNGGSKEIIIDGKNGFIFNEDFQSFLISIKTIINKPDGLLSEIGNNAKNTIINNYLWPLVVKKFKRVISF